MSHEALIFAVQRACVHDGPGLRTAVFFKGCSLACGFCQNPESISPRAEMAVYAERCRECGGCAEACPRSAILPLHAGRLDRTRCDSCGLCADACPTRALVRVGRIYAVDALLAECLADRDFFVASGGGITLSGGEPVLQSDFLEVFLPRLKAEDVHVLLETAGNYPWPHLGKLLPHIDQIYFDWKLPDAYSYREHTGHSHDRIVANLARLIEKGAPVEVRMPILPSINDEDAAVATTSQALSRLGVSRLSLLRYNSLWEAKLPRLRSIRSHPPWVGPAKNPDLQVLVNSFRRNGIDAVVH